MEVWPPRSQTSKFRLPYCTDLFVNVTKASRRHRGVHSLDIEANSRYRCHHFANLALLESDPYRRHWSQPLVCIKVLSCQHCPVAVSEQNVHRDRNRCEHTSPRINIRMSFFPQIRLEKYFDIEPPIVAGWNDRL